MLQYSLKNLLCDIVISIQTHDRNSDVYCDRYFLFTAVMLLKNQHTIPLIGAFTALSA